MNLNNIGIWVSILALAVTGGIAWGVDHNQTGQNTKDIDDMKDTKEQTVRIEERQIRIQEDVKKILDKLEDTQ